MRANDMNRAQTEVIVRKNLDFGFDDSIPRYWFGGEAFKTRMFDAMSALFPEGERFFIESVRHYREQVRDLTLLDELKAFMKQEGQHGQIHALFNERLKSQGIDVNGIERGSRQAFTFIKKVFSPQYAIALTAATEHLTALLAEVLTSRLQACESAHPKLRALYVWHAMEEYEHKAVAYDVMLQAAKVGYWYRILGMLQLSIGFPLHVGLVINHMLKVDGHGFWRRMIMWMKGTWWLWGWRGLLWPIIAPYLAYYSPSFHPSKRAPLPAYDIWRAEFDRNQDPLRADQMLFGTATPASAPFRS